MSRLIALRGTLALLLLLAGSPAAFCQDETAPASPTTSAAATGDAEDSDPGKEAAAKERSRQRDLSLAQIELKIAEISAQIQTMGASSATSKAAREVAEAEAALVHFVENELPVQIEQATISHDRSLHSAEHAADELAELEAMYSAEEFAEMTKELVLRRGRRSLEIAERNLAVEKAKLKNLTEEELPRKKRDLQAKLADARDALKKAELSGAKTELENVVLLTKARNRILSLEESAPSKDVDS